MSFFKYIAEKIRTLLIDYRTQGTSLGGDVLSVDDSKIYKTSNSSYQDLELIFKRYYQVQPADSLVDVGCGKARVFSYLLFQGYRNHMTGYEINTEVAKETARRLKRYSNVSILAEDIFDDFPVAANVFYLYHPFKEPLMRQFVEHILKIRHLSPVVIYNNPVFINAFDPDQFQVEIHDFAGTHHHHHLKFAIIKLSNNSDKLVNI